MGGNAVFPTSCVQKSIGNFVQAIIPRTYSLVGQWGNSREIRVKRKRDRQAFKNPLGRGRATDHHRGVHLLVNFHKESHEARVSVCQGEDFVSSCTMRKRFPVDLLKSMDLLKPPLMDLLKSPFTHRQSLNFMCPFLYTGLGGR